MTISQLDQMLSYVLELHGLSTAELNGMPIASMDCQAFGIELQDVDKPDLVHLLRKALWAVVMLHDNFNKLRELRQALSIPSRNSHVQ